MAGTPDQDDVRAGLARAEARLREGDASGAFEALKACCRADPANGPAVAAMGLFLAEHGEPGAAAGMLSRAMRLPDAPAERVAPALARLLAGLRPDGWNPRLGEDLGLCLASPYVDPQALAPAVARALLLKDAGFDGSDAAVDAVAAEPLWLAFLSRCLNVSAPMEARLEALGAALRAGRGAAGPARDELACALGLQAFASELGEVGAAPGDGRMQKLLVRRTVDEPAREAALAVALPAFTAASGDAVSAAVKGQYEANPYPRWSAPPSPSPRSLREVVAALPGLDRAAFSDTARQVLVAGCGTGFEPIDLARMDPSLAITAMDLSRRSLAYGARMAEEAGVRSVRFGQGDILALDMPGRFDVVVSTGVIHHMDDPARGLARLAAAVRPGGVLRLGLYSERARALVRLAHDLIRDRGWAATEAGVRAFRAHVLALPDTAPLARLRESEDFYSLSGCRDLVFHVREHRYTPSQLGDLLATARLRLVGFEAPPEASALFRQAFGPSADALDLTLWDQLETRRPTLFAGMYHLWAQRPKEE